MYILLFILLFFFILWTLKPNKKPTLSKKDLAAQKELLNSIDEDLHNRVIDMHLDDMGIKSSRDNTF